MIKSHSIRRIRYAVPASTFIRQQQQQQQQSITRVIQTRMIRTTTTIRSSQQHILRPIFTQLQNDPFGSSGVGKQYPTMLSDRTPINLQKIHNYSTISSSVGSITTTILSENKKQHHLLQHQRSRSLHDLISYSDRMLINEMAREPQTSVSLQALMRTGRGEYLHKTFGDKVELNNQQAATELVLIQVASFLRRELPIRMAHRIQDLEGIPVLRDMESVKQVRDLYVKSFLEIMEFDSKITTVEQENDFSLLIERIYERHSSVLVQMARGAYEFRKAVRTGSGINIVTNGTSIGTEFELQEETHAFLDRFYLCRIGIRVLIGQYLALRQPAVENYIGIICSQTSPYEIVKRAIDDAAFMCTRKYGDSPEVIMSGRLDLSFPYVPTHLHYIMLELIKNSMRATVEWHGVDSDFPPIKVIIADGQENEDVVIKVSDEGGGIPRSNMKKIWSYLFTTADPSIQEGMVGTKQQNVVDHGIDSPLAGLGYGLPISRSYCRYFGGDLSIMSMEGYGTDAFVYLTRLGNTKEPLPI